MARRDRRFHGSVQSRRRRRHRAGRQQRYLARQLRRQRASLTRLILERSNRKGRFRRSYTSYRVILVCFIGDDTGSASELYRFGLVLERRYGAKVDWCKIPRRFAQYHLNTQMRAHLNASQGKDELFIIAYAGHGGRSRDGKDLYISARKHSPAIRLSGILFDSRRRQGKDLLVFLDCCDAGSATREDHAIRMDVFCACPATGDTPSNAQETSQSERSSTDSTFLSHVTEVVRTAPPQLTMLELFKRVQLRLPGVSPELHSYPRSTQQPIRLTRTLSISGRRTRQTG